MKKIHIKLGILSLLFFLTTACKDFLDINTDPNNPSEVNNLSLIISDMTSTTAYNQLGGGNFARFTAQWMQHIANNATPPSNDTYRFTTADFNNDWAFYAYTSVLANGKYVMEKGAELQAWNHVAIAKILTAHSYALLTDFFGDIPFTEALQRSGNIKPKYDTQEQVYAGIQTLLDEAIADIDKNAALAVGPSDYFLGGNMARWKKTAYTLKARYHLRLTNAPGKTSAGQATLALNALANAISSTAESPRVAYPGSVGAEAPWNQWITKFSTNIQSSKSFVDLMHTLNDPRLPFFAQPAVNTGNYVGYPNGTLAIFVVQDISNLGTGFIAANASVYLTSYVERKFLEAEANFRLGNTAAAEEAYAEAIKANMNLVSNAAITATQQNDYLAAHPLTDLESLITQKYIAGFIIASIEAYHDYRRTGFPALTPALNADFNQLPTRIPYPDTEINNNVENVPTGITPISKVWWDAN